MNSTFKNVLVVIAGIIIGSIVNMGIIMISGSITMEGLKSTMHLFEPKHFLFPFLAHALGTLVGAFVAAKIAATRKQLIALLIGVFFLIGGSISISMLDGPMWFNALDLLMAYIPMAYLGWMFANK